MSTSISRLEQSTPTVDSWAADIDEEKASLNRHAEAEIWSKLSIYRVPSHIANLNLGAYTPQVVSLGPYHHDEDLLKPMEEHKRRALIHLLVETKKSVEDYVQPLRSIKSDLMNAYEQLPVKWQHEEKFLRLMVLDGCFVIEILRKNFANYNSSDPIFSEERQPTVLQYIKRDMMLMENQLPLLVLEMLAAVIRGATGVSCNIKGLLLKLYLPRYKRTQGVQGKHMLDVVRSAMLQFQLTQSLQIDDSKSSGKTGLQTQPTESLPIDDSKSSGKIGRSARDLRRAGIKFIKNESNSLTEVTLGDKGLHLPSITIEHHSETMFLNSIAFERLHLDKGRYMSSFFLFMLRIVTSDEDVKLLREKDIIESSVLGDVDIAQIIKKLVKDMSFVSTDPLYDLQQHLHKHCIKSENKLQRKLKHWWIEFLNKYFKSPWSIISLCAAAFGLGMATGQTWYTALGYYHTKKH